MGRSIRQTDDMQASDLKQIADWISGVVSRAPLPEEGYHVVFLSFTADNLAGDYAIFADGFAGGMASPEGAAHRPVGLAQGPDGALYLSDDKAGRIWRITYAAPK